MALTRPAPAPPDPEADRGRPRRRAARPAAVLAVVIAVATGTAGALLSPPGRRPLIIGLELAAVLATAAALILAGRASEPDAPPAAAAPPDPVVDQRPEPPAPRVRHPYVSLARRIQALVNRQLRELREMEDRHGADPAVFADLLHLDHATALIGRLADSLAVLGGERTGRRWTRPAPLLAVFRGAMSRITEYRRVTIGTLPESAAVAGEAVEALVHALAELLDNATRYSPPDTHVVLRAARLADGLVIEVEDSGVGLGPEARARAAQVLATENAGLEAAALGTTPRLGLAVVGRLARAAGFKVSLAPGEGGGVRASILLPARLITEALPEPDPAPAASPLTRSEPPRSAASARHAAAGTAPASINGLPRRRRYTPEAERPTPPPPAAPPPAPAPAPPDAGPGQWLGHLHGPPREGLSPRKKKEGMAP
ncbi:sensor histidine kinase [Actinospica robiniae]|uniref:sensor histidine kinase n=1 Tax=Actinospica robiniae TaxID=304901 RepID=UPI000422901A|nr:ATP-binding protein [Actinospica robiniae]